jgi:integrase
MSATSSAWTASCGSPDQDPPFEAHRAATADLRPGTAVSKATSRQGMNQRRPVALAGHRVSVHHRRRDAARASYVSRLFVELCAKHGFRQVRLHDMRHTCMPRLLSLGLNPRVVIEIVGHSAIEMTMNVYGYVSLDSQREALGLLDNQLGTPTDDQPEE